MRPKYGKLQKATAAINSKATKIVSSSGVQLCRNLDRFCRHFRYPLKLNEVFIETFKNKGRIILNRPDDQNTLSISMVNQIFPVLKQWQETKALVIVKAAGEEAFCGGNDARGLVEAELRGESYAKKFYHVGLSLNALIANYKIPYVVLMDGLVSGDGAGLTVHAEYSICTERTVFSMPHCSFGFFPDMGATYFLPRLQGELGKYLGLTGHEIAGRDVQRINLATHYCDSNRIKDLERELERCDTHEEVISVLRKHESKDLDHFSLVPILEQIDHCFSGNTIEEIMKRLSEDPSTWAQESLKEMKYNSPMSLKVTLEALKRGRKMSLRDCLNMEYNMAQMAISHKDLYEGVRANIIDKDRNPSWRPATLEEVTDEHVLAFFPKMRIKSII